MPMNQAKSKEKPSPISSIMLKMFDMQRDEQKNI